MFNDGKWSAICTEPFYCDYFRAQQLAKEILNNTQPATDDTNVRELLAIMQRGALLPTFTQYEWFDTIKIDVEDIFCNVIEKLLPDLYGEGKYNETLQCAEILFSIDNFNENALLIRLKF